MLIDINSDLTYNVREDGCDPIVFVPEVNLYTLEAPNIIDAF